MGTMPGAEGGEGSLVDEPPTNPAGGLATTGWGQLVRRAPKCSLGVHIRAVSNVIARDLNQGASRVFGVFHFVRGKPLTHAFRQRGQNRKCSRSLWSLECRASLESPQCGNASKKLGIP